MRGPDDRLADLHHLLATIAPGQPRVDSPPEQSDVAEVVELDSEVEQHDLARMKMMPKLCISQHETLACFFQSSATAGLNTYSVLFSSIIDSIFTVSFSNK